MITEIKQRWEYLALQVITLKTFGGFSTTVDSEDKEFIKSLKEIKTPQALLNHLGSDGWELVHTVPGPATGANTWLLKRPKG